MKEKLCKDGYGSEKTSSLVQAQSPWIVIDTVFVKEGFENFEMPPFLENDRKGGVDFNIPESGTHVECKISNTTTSNTINVKYKKSKHAILFKMPIINASLRSVIVQYVIYNNPYGNVDDHDVILIYDNLDPLKTLKSGTFLPFDDGATSSDMVAFMVPIDPEIIKTHFKSKSNNHYHFYKELIRVKVSVELDLIYSGYYCTRKLEFFSPAFSLEHSSKSSNTSVDKDSSLSTPFPFSNPSFSFDDDGGVMDYSGRQFVPSTTREGTPLLYHFSFVKKS